MEAAERERERLAERVQVQLRTREAMREKSRQGEAEEKHPKAVKTKILRSDAMLLRFPREVCDAIAMQDERISRLPRHLERFDHLVRLDVSGNYLAVLPDSVMHMTSLEELLLNRNLLTALPPSLAHLTRLQRLEVRGNKLATLPDMEDMMSLARLDVSENMLVTIPNSLGYSRSLRSLDLRYNQLRSLPEQLGFIGESMLELLSDFNFVYDMPSTLKKLYNLHTLQLSNNRIKTLPNECLEFLTSLTSLDVSHNFLQAIPKAIGLCKNIGSLYMNNNKIKRLPRSIQGMISLVTLQLSNNQIENLPALTALTSLRELHASNNKLQGVDISLHLMTHLSVLDLRENPEIRFPPPSIVSQGKAKILESLQQEAKRKSEQDVLDRRLHTIISQLLVRHESFENLDRTFRAAMEDTGSMSVDEFFYWMKVHDKLNAHDIRFLAQHLMDVSNSVRLLPDSLERVYVRVFKEEEKEEEEEDDVEALSVKSFREILTDMEMSEAAKQAEEERLRVQRRMEEKRRNKKMQAR